MFQNLVVQHEVIEIDLVELRKRIVQQTAAFLRAFGCEEVGFGDTTGMANPRQVDGFYAGLPALHAVVNIAGGFAYAPIADSPPAIRLAMISRPMPVRSRSTGRPGRETAAK